MNLTQKKQLLESALHESYKLRFALRDFLSSAKVDDKRFVIDGKNWVRFDSFRQQDIIFYLDSWIARINKIQELREGVK